MEVTFARAVGPMTRGGPRWRERRLLGLCHLFRDLLYDRLPGPLLAYGELSDFVRRHRVRIGAELSEFFLYFRIVHRLAKIDACFLDDRIGRPSGCQQHVPAAGDEAR